MYMNLVYHPISIVLDAQLQNTYTYNENGDQKLYLVFKKMPYNLNRNGLNYNKYFSTYFEMIDETSNAIVYALYFAPGEDLKTKFTKQDYISNVCDEAKFIILFDVFERIKDNHPLICELIKINLKTQICPPFILPPDNVEAETYTKQKLLLI